MMTKEEISDVDFFVLFKDHPTRTLLLNHPNGFHMISGYLNEMKRHLENNNYGLYLYYSNNNSIINNTFVGAGIDVWKSYDNVVVDNVVNGKPLVYLEGVVGGVVEDAGQVVLVRCLNVTVRNNEISDTRTAIELFYSNNTIIENNSMRSNAFSAIYAVYSCNNIGNGYPL